MPYAALKLLEFLNALLQIGDLMDEALDNRAQGDRLLLRGHASLMPE